MPEKSQIPNSPINNFAKVFPALDLKQLGGILVNLEVSNEKLLGEATIPSSMKHTPEWSQICVNPLLNHGLWVILINQLVNGLHYPKLISVVRCIHNIAILQFITYVQSTEWTGQGLDFSFGETTTLFHLIGRSNVYIYTYIYNIIYI